MNKNSMNKTPVFALKLATFVIALGYSLIIPVMPFYMKNLGAGGKELGWLTAIYALTQTLCAPFWGVLSDRIGRKPIISIGMLGYTISLLLFGLASSFWTLFIARALSGILSSATSVASLAYVGDSSTEDKRSKNMGQLGAAMSIGVMLGPLFGGILAGYSLALPFFTGAGISFIAFLLIVTVLPESIERSGYPHKKDSLKYSLWDRNRSFRRTAFPFLGGLPLPDFWREGFSKAVQLHFAFVTISIWTVSSLVSSWSLFSAGTERKYRSGRRMEFPDVFAARYASSTICTTWDAQDTVEASHPKVSCRPS